MATRMCQYGNCHVDVVMSSGNGVSVNYYGQDKPAFCSGLHAAYWLLKRDRRTAYVAEEIEARLSLKPRKVT